MDVVERVVVIEIVGIIAEIVAQAVGIVKKHREIQSTDDQPDVRIPAERRFQTAVDLVIRPAGKAGLDRGNAEQRVQLRGTEVFRHGGAGDHGVIIEMAENAVVLGALVIETVEELIGLRRVIVEIGIDVYNERADKEQQSQHETAPSDEPLFCFHRITVKS